MATAIRNKATGEVLSVYEGTRYPVERRINEFDFSLANPEIVEHIEIPDQPGEPGDYDLDPATLTWIPNLPATRARLLGEFEREGFRRVAAVHPPHHLSRLGLLPPGNSEAKEASALIGGVRRAVNEAEDAMDLITDIEELEAFEPTWPE